MSGEGIQMRELSREECLELVAAHRFGRLAIGMGEGAPVIRPVNYVFDSSSQAIVFRTAQGSKFYAMLKAARGAFEVDGIDEHNGTGWSVIVSGAVEEVTGARDLRRLESLNLELWAPGPKPHWMHIRAATVSGRSIELNG